MIKIRVERVINKTPEEVFDAISDHENYKRFPRFNDSKLLQPGKTEKNGLGARRYISAGSSSVEEIITCFERPSRMDYHVEVMKPAIPMIHTKGEVTMVPHNGKTKVVWISEGHIEIPILGFILEKISNRLGSRLFDGVLKYIDQH